MVERPTVSSPNRNDTGQAPSSSPFSAGSERAPHRLRSECHRMPTSIPSDCPKTRFYAALSRRFGSLVQQHRAVAQQEEDERRDPSGGGGIQQRRGRPVHQPARETA